MADREADGARSEERLVALRASIDEVNVRLLETLQERARLVVEIASVKMSIGLDAHDPNREDQMLKALALRARGPFGGAEIEAIFRAIFEASLRVQERERQRPAALRAPTA